MNNSISEDIYTTTAKKICMPLCDRNTSIDLSNDFTLPDYHSEIRRVLNVRGLATPASKYITSSGVEFSGNIDYNVLYVGADGELFSAPLDCEYRFTVPIDSDGFDFNEEVISCLDISLDNISVRLLAPRKLNVKCKLKAHTRVYGTFVINENLGENHENSAIQVLKGNCDNLLVHNAVSDIIEFSEEIFTNDPNIRVAAAQGKLCISNVDSAIDTVNVKGEILLDLLICNNDVSHSYDHLTKRIDFSQSMEAIGVNGATKCIANGCLTDLAISVEDERIICDLKACVEVEGQTQKSFEYIKDVYSTNYKSNCTFKDYNVPSSGYCYNGNYSINERISKDSVLIPQDSQIVDLSVSASVDHTGVVGNKVVCAGNVKYTLILNSNGEFSSVDVILPTKFEFEGVKEDDMICQSKFNVLNSKARLDEDVLCLDSEIGVVSSGYCNKKIIALDAVNLSSPINKSKGVITVYYPNSEDTLWSISKQYNVPKAHVEKLNSLNGNIEGREYIII